MFFLLFFSSFFFMLKNFSKKLIFLLLLECSFLICLYVIFFGLGAGSGSSSCSLMVLVFMVLDSVLAVSFLFYLTRNSSLLGLQFHHL